MANDIAVDTIWGFIQGLHFYVNDMLLSHIKKLIFSGTKSDAYVSWLRDSKASLWKWLYLVLTVAQLVCHICFGNILVHQIASRLPFPLLPIYFSFSPKFRSLCYTLANQQYIKMIYRLLKRKLHFSNSMAPTSLEL